VTRAFRRRRHRRTMTSSTRSQSASSHRLCACTIFFSQTCFSTTANTTRSVWICETIIANRLKAERRAEIGSHASVRHVGRGSSAAVWRHYNCVRRLPRRARQLFGFFPRVETMRTKNFHAVIRRPGRRRNKAGERETVGRWVIKTIVSAAAAAATAKHDGEANDCCRYAVHHQSIYLSAAVIASTQASSTTGKPPRFPLLT